LFFKTNAISIQHYTDDKKKLEELLSDAKSKLEPDAELESDEDEQEIDAGDMWWRYATTTTTTKRRYSTHKRFFYIVVNYRLLMIQQQNNTFKMFKLVHNNNVLIDLTHVLFLGECCCWIPIGLSTRTFV
jgi:hypothetical protein